MPEYVDALAGRLAELQRDGSLPWSQLSQGMQAALRGLLDTGVLDVVKAGRGQRVLVVGQEQLERFIRHRYPRGLISAEAAGRAAAIREARSAKHGNQRSRFSSVVVRVLRENSLMAPGAIDADLQRLTALYGAAVFVLGREVEARCCGIVVTVENEDVFHRIEELIPQADVAIYTAGCMSLRLLEWLARQDGVQQIIHAGDYDPVGISEYLRLQTALGERVSLHLPADLDVLFEQYSDPAILQRPSNQRAMERVRDSQDAAARRVAALIQRHGAGLEQEVLLSE